jgi:hypothetical protein
MDTWLVGRLDLGRWHRLRVGANAGAQRIPMSHAGAAMCINETKFEPAWSPHRGPFDPVPVCAHALRAAARTQAGLAASAVEPTASA